MSNDELKKKLDVLKKEKLDKLEKERLEKEINKLELEKKGEDKKTKIIKKVGKGLISFAKFSNKVLENQTKKMEKKYK